MASVAVQRECTFCEQEQEYFVQEETPSQRLLYMILKRAFDIAASLMAGIVLFIPMLIIVATIRLDSEGPAIFKQERLGKDGKPFMMYKFRTMYMDAEKMDLSGLQWEIGAALV